MFVDIVLPGLMIMDLVPCSEGIIAVVEVVYLMVLYYTIAIHPHFPPPPHPTLLFMFQLVVMLSLLME